MSEYAAEVIWERDGARFTDNRYSRGHSWRFDGGLEVPASASPSVVRPPFSVEAAVDPEEAFVASLSSCHMLWFLSLAAADGHVVERYRDRATGVMAQDEDGGQSMQRVTLRPAVTFAGDGPPTAEHLESLHQRAHGRCFIARSVRTEVRCEPVLEADD